MLDQLPNEEDPKPMPVIRPKGLLFICILTFIFSGLSFFSFFFCSLFYSHLPEIIKASPFTKEVPGIEGLADASIWFYILNTLFYGVSLAGAILMLLIRKVGFHLYAVSQLLLLIIPMIFIQGYKGDFSGFALTGIFILIYYSYMRQIK
jgi:hypothetical protein